jgi:hypothetical protein
MALLISTGSTHGTGSVCVDRGFEPVEIADIDLCGDNAPVVSLDQCRGFRQILR